MQAPPPVLAGLHVVAYAEADDSVVFEQRHTLNVDGKWLGRVPYLAVCQEFDTLEYAVQHCTDEWDLLGIAAGYKSADDAKAAIERTYHGLGAKWILAATSFEEARALDEADMLASACSFCGKTPRQVQIIIGDEVRICGECVDGFHTAIHRSEPAT
jgi:ClpX C4-type zinc finger